MKQKSVLVVSVIQFAEPSQRRSDMFVITTDISHQGRDVEVYYVGRGTGVDTIWSDRREESMKLVTRESAEELAKELMEVTTVRELNG